MALRSVHLLAGRVRGVTTLQQYYSRRHISAVDPTGFSPSVVKAGTVSRNEDQNANPNSAMNESVLRSVGLPSSRVSQYMSTGARWVDELMQRRSSGQGMPRKQIAAIGGAVFVGFTAISGSIYFLDGPSSVYLLGSFGSSTALVYSAPDAPVSQPRNIVIGHALSAFVGVSVYKAAMLLDWALWFSAPVAVTVSVVAMHASRTFHPPAVSSGLTALIGCSALKALGYSYVLMPCTIIPAAIVMIGSLLTQAGAVPGVKYPKSWF
jgi:CBS domain-containing membrane protein